MAVLLVLLKERNYEVHSLDEPRFHDVHTKFHDGGFRSLSDITVTTANILEAIMSVLLIEDFRGVCR
jgi:hypothetical protein